MFFASTNVARRAATATGIAGASSAVVSLSLMASNERAQLSNVASQRVMSTAMTRLQQQYASRSVILQQPASSAAVMPARSVLAPPPMTAAGTKSFSSASFSTSGTGSKSFLEWYEGHLATRPILTKMCTGTVLWSIGDAVAQMLPPMAAGQEFPTYDYKRTARAAVFGFVIHAPASHVHFNFLEWLTLKSGITGLGIPVFKAFVEQFVYWSWLSNSLYHGCMGAMQGQTMDQVYHRIADNIWETQKAQWLFWIPVQLLNFRFVPVRHQLNVVLLASIAWTALLSAWYPPEPADSEKKDE